MASNKNINARYLRQYSLFRKDWQKRENEEQLDFEAYILRDFVMDLEEDDLLELLEDIFKENHERLSLIFPFEEEGSVIFLGFKWLYAAPLVVVNRITKLLQKIHKNACDKKYPNHKRVLNNLLGVFDEYKISLPYEYIRNLVLDTALDKTVRLQLLILKAKHEPSPNEEFWRYIEQKVEGTDFIFLPALLELSLNSQSEEGLEKAIELLNFLDHRFEKNLDLTPYFRYYIEEILYRIYSMPRSGDLFIAANHLESKLSKYSPDAAALVRDVKNEPALKRIIREHPESDTLKPGIEYEEASSELHRKYGFN